MNKSFKLRAPDKMGPGGVWRKLMRCKTHGGLTVNLDPTVESKSKGEGHCLEWDVPDTDYNREHIALYMPNYTVIEASEVQKPVVKEPSEKKKIQSPMVRKKLKSEKMEELDAIGVEYPENATLKDLEKILEDAKAEAILDAESED